MRTVTTDEDLVTERVSVVSRVASVLDWAFGVLYTLLLIRLALAFIDARHSAGFTQFIDRISDPFYAPFKGIVASHAVAGQLVVWPLVVALVAYMILHALIRGVLRLVAR